MALTTDQIATVTVLLQANKSIKEISKFAGLDRDAVTEIARSSDLEPSHPTLKRAKELFGSADGHSYQAIADTLNAEGLRAENGKKIHYLTVSTWVANLGWRWGGDPSGDYIAPSPGSNRSKARFALRMTKETAAALNRPSAIDAAADAAWSVLDDDQTDIVQVAVIKGAATAGVTDIDAVRKAVLKRHGDKIRNAQR